MAEEGRSKPEVAVACPHCIHPCALEFRVYLYQRWHPTAPSVPWTTKVCDWWLPYVFSMTGDSAPCLWGDWWCCLTSVSVWTCMCVCICICVYICAVCACSICVWELLSASQLTENQMLVVLISTVLVFQSDNSLRFVEFTEKSPYLTEGELDMEKRNGSW